MIIYSINILVIWLVYNNILSVFDIRHLFSELKKVLKNTEKIQGKISHLKNLILNSEKYNNYLVLDFY